MRDERHGEDRGMSEPKGGALKGSGVVQLCAHHLRAKYQMEKGPRDTRKRRCIITKSRCFPLLSLLYPECCRVIPYLTLLVHCHPVSLFICLPFYYHFLLSHRLEELCLRDSQSKKIRLTYKRILNVKCLL